MSPIGSQIDDDILDIVEDDEYPSDAAAPARAWRVLVVDDDEEVHRATTFSLSGIEILDHGLSLSHAYSAAEATALLRRDTDFAVILLDVVMETEDAGLRLVRLIREDLGLATVRIILRTGQPGYAPELSVIRDYDINDYRTKSELTRARLLTSLYSSLRAYSHIQALENSRRGLEQIIEASAELFRQHSLTAFCEGVLIQLGGLLDIEANGIVLARTWKSGDPATSGPAERGPVVLAAAGPFRDLSGCPLSVIPDQPLKALLLRTLEQRASVFEPNATILHIVGPSGDDLAVYLATRRLLDPMDRKLLEVFSSNIALGFDNASLIDHIRTLAFLDPLTRLPNRIRFQIEIADRLEAMRLRGGNERLMVMLLDLDHFQTVNDGLGARAGDGLLIEVGRQFQLIFGEPGAVSRLASDMFGVLVELDGPDDEQRVLEDILGRFGTPFPVEGSEISVKTSGGYVVTDREETDVFRLVRHAGMALKRCKKNGRGHIVRFETVMEAELRQRLVLVSHIAEAQATGQFFLVYQPQLRLSDLAVVGVEALLRWRRPDGTFIQPDAFIPAAEDAGHMVALGEWVLRQACLRQVQWRTRGVARLRVAVNVSVRQLRDGDEFVRTALRTAQDTQADPSDIELEITESDGIEQERILPIVQQLREIGFRIAIDDFGTGYSSLARLQQLPASLLKIDRSFVQDIDFRSENRSIASMIVKMGHELGFSTIAEGVETAAQEAVLRDLGCDAVQGFLYARPMPPDELEIWLEGRAVA